MARFDSVPSVLKTANTLSCSTSRRTACTVCAGLYASSTMRYSIFRFATPPPAFTKSKYAFAPRATEAYDAAGPVSGDVPPMTMVVALMPGSAAEPANAVGKAQDECRAQGGDDERERRRITSTESSDDS